MADTSGLPHSTDINKPARLIGMGGVSKRMRAQAIFLNRINAILPPTPLAKNISRSLAPKAASLSISEFQNLYLTAR
jgi:hypothetical protein